MVKKEENYSIMDMKKLKEFSFFCSYLFEEILLWHANDLINEWCCWRALYRISPERNERCLKPSSFNNNKALPKN